MEIESSEDDYDFPTHEWITPQSKVKSDYQSISEQGIRKLCCELLELKDAVENLCGNSHSKYLSFQRILEEVMEVEHELIELQKHASSERFVVLDLMTDVSSQLDEWKKVDGEGSEAEDNPQISELHVPLLSEVDVHRMTFLENIDVLLAEHKVEEALNALLTEKKSFSELSGAENTSSTEISSYESAVSRRKAKLENKLVGIMEKPSVDIYEVKKASFALFQLGQGPLAHQLLLKAYESNLLNSIEGFLPSCSFNEETYSAILSKFVFSTIFRATKESRLIFGDIPVYTNRIVQWAECQIESFVRLVKENAPSSEMVSALRAVSICVQASLNHCLLLEPQGLKLNKLLLVLLQPYIEDVLEKNFGRARTMLLNYDDILTPQFAYAAHGPTASSSDNVHADSGTRFIFIVKDIVKQITPEVINHFGATILLKISQFFDKYVEILIKALPGPSEDDNFAESKEYIYYRAETDSQQLVLLGTAYTVADELLPMAASRLWSGQNEWKESGRGPTENISATSSKIEFKEWKRHLQHSLDKLRDHFCRQYVLNFIYSREGKTRLDAQIYLQGPGEDLVWEASLPFQALFGKIQQLATVAGDVLLGKEKTQKTLLARLTETVVMWLSDEQEFWDVFEDDSYPLQPLGLQQLILDMHFIVEIAVRGCYPFKNVQQIASAITARAIRTFTARGIDPQSSLPEDEWFVITAKAAIDNLLMRTSGSEASDTDDEHIMLHDEIISDSEDTGSCLSSSESSASFASANMGEMESPNYLTDPEA